MNRETPRYKVERHRNGSWAILDTHRVMYPYTTDRADREHIDRVCDDYNART